VQEGLSIDGDGIVVTFVGGRHQRVYVDDVDGALELTGFVARQAAVQSVPDACLRAWERNRTTHLVGFRVDRSGRLVGDDPRRPRAATAPRVWSRNGHAALR